MIKYGLPALCLCVSMTAALAHSKSEQTTPANASVVEAVDRISIQFDGPMLVTAFTLVGPDGDIAVTRDTAMEPNDVFEASPSVALPQGAYTVEWRGLSADGHPMQGDFGFTVAQ